MDNENNDNCNNKGCCADGRKNCPYAKANFKTFEEACAFVSTLDEEKCCLLQSAIVSTKTGYGKELGKSRICDYIQYTHGVTHDGRKTKIAQACGDTFHELDFTNRTLILMDSRPSLVMKGEMRRVLTIIQHYKYSLENGLDHPSLEEALTTLHIVCPSERQTILDTYFGVNVYKVKKKNK